MSSEHFDCGVMCCCCYINLDVCLLLKVDGGGGCARVVNVNAIVSEEIYMIYRDLKKKDETTFDFIK